MRTMSTFRAILTCAITYRTIDDVARTLPAGTPLLVSQVTFPVYSTDSNGNTRQEPPGAFFGALGEDSFDLGREEFAPLN